jgi:hypothetical protein
MLVWRNQMTKWWWVLLSGALGGAFCGFVILLSSSMLFDPTYVDLLWTLQLALLMGSWFGAPVGLVAFSLCYYLMLRRIPLRLSLTYTIPATICAAWAGFGIPSIGILSGSLVGILIELYGGAVIGLVVTSIFLSKTFRPSESPSA